LRDGFGDAHLASLAWLSLETSLKARSLCLPADWFSTWCKGCKTIYPDLCKLASTFAGARIKFIKANTDKVKALSKQQQVKALPQAGLYRPNHGRLVAFGVTPSKLKILKANVQTVLRNTDKFFKLDPNGYAVPVDTDPTPELGIAKKAADKLKASTGGLYDALTAMANGTCAPRPALRVQRPSCSVCALRRAAASCAETVLDG
jgi:thiol-disulfide isomerase/thioredoxin